MEIKLKCDGFGPNYTAEVPDEFFDRLAAAIKRAGEHPFHPITEPPRPMTAISAKARNREKR